MGFLLLFCSLLPSPETWPYPLPPLKSMKGVARVLSLTKGCVLILPIHKGMPADTVQRLLGVETCEIGWSSATYHRGVTFWDSLGIVVSWQETRAATGETAYEVKTVRYDWGKWSEWGKP